jgi:nucleoside phosphorylase
MTPAEALMPIEHDLEDLILYYDPARPQLEYFESEQARAAAVPEKQSLEPVPWPAGLAPAAAPISPPPRDDRELPEADVLLVTWTVAEARALAQLFTPDVDFDEWYEYRHKVDDFIPKVTEKKAPFNNKELKRYYHTLGLYFPCTIGKTRVLALKSGLHFAKDGPQMPVLDLWRQIVGETGCKVVITTGTGGGIGKDTSLGDIAIAKDVRFDCQKTFKDRPFAKEGYPSSPLPQGVSALVTPALLKPNQMKLEDPGHDLELFLPEVDRGPDIVSTDFFAFDDSTNYYKLQGLGRVCDMGDAVLGLALGPKRAAVRWYAVRNASDPQIDNPDGDMKKAAEEAAQCYLKYGLYTTAGSVVASWALIVAAFN